MSLHFFEDISRRCQIWCDEHKVSLNSLDFYSVLNCIILFGRVILRMFKMIEKPQKLKISEIKKKYPKQWVVVDITERDIYGFPASGKVRLQANNIDLILEKTQNIEGDLYIFYTGSIDDEIE